MQVHTFTINAPSTATLETFSYGDGTNGAVQFGLCGDGALTINNLQAGTYTAHLNGLSLSDGFLEEGEGNFTRPQLCGTTGGLFDAGCNQRSAN